MSFQERSKLEVLARGRVGKVVPGSRNNSFVEKWLAHRRNQEKLENLVSMGEERMGKSELCGSTWKSEGGFSSLLNVSCAPQSYCPCHGG